MKINSSYKSSFGEKKNVADNRQHLMRIAERFRFKKLAENSSNSSISESNIPSEVNDSYLGQPGQTNLQEYLIKDVEDFLDKIIESGNCDELLELNLTDLDLTGSSILKKLQFFSKLQVLNLSNTNLTNEHLQSLKGCIVLNKLDLSNNSNLSDISVLYDLKNVKFELNGTNVVDPLPPSVDPPRIPKVYKVNRGWMRKATSGEASFIQNRLFHDCLELGFNEELNFKRSRSQSSHSRDAHVLTDSSNQKLIQWLKVNFLTVIVKKPEFFQDHPQVKTANLFTYPFSEKLDQQLKELIQNKDFDTIEKFISYVFKDFHLIELESVLDVLNQNILQLTHELQLHLLRCCTNIEYSFSLNKSEEESKIIEDKFNASDIVGKEIDVQLRHGETYKGKIFSVEDASVIVNYYNGESGKYKDYMKDNIFNFLKEPKNYYDFSFGRHKTEDTEKTIVDIFSSKKMVGKQIQVWEAKIPKKGTIHNVKGDVVTVKFNDRNIVKYYNYMKFEVFDILDKDNHDYEYVSENERIGQHALFSFLFQQDLNAKLLHFQKLTPTQKYNCLKHVPPLIEITDFSEGLNYEYFNKYLLDTSVDLLSSYIDYSALLVKNISDLERKKNFLTNMPFTLKIEIFLPENYASFNDLFFNDSEFFMYMIGDLLNPENYEEFQLQKNKNISERFIQTILFEKGEVFKLELLNEAAQENFTKIVQKYFQFHWTPKILDMNIQDLNNFCQEYVATCSPFTLENVIDIVQNRTHLQLLLEKIPDKNIEIVLKIFDTNGRFDINFFNDSYLETPTRWFLDIIKNTKPDFLNTCCTNYWVSLVSYISDDNELKRLVVSLNDEVVTNLIKNLNDLTLKFKVLQMVKDENPKLYTQCLNQCSNQELGFFIENLADYKDLELMLTDLSDEHHLSLLQFLLSLFIKNSNRVTNFEEKKNTIKFIQLIKNNNPQLLNKCNNYLLQNFVEKVADFQDLELLFDILDESRLWSLINHLNLIESSTSYRWFHTKPEKAKMFLKVIAEKKPNCLKCSFSSFEMYIKKYSNYQDLEILFNVLIDSTLLTFVSKLPLLDSLLFDYYEQYSSYSNKLTNETAKIVLQLIVKKGFFEETKVTREINDLIRKFLDITSSFLDLRYSKENLKKLFNALPDELLSLLIKKSTYPYKRTKIVYLIKEYRPNFLNNCDINELEYLLIKPKDLEILSQELNSKNLQLFLEFLNSKHSPKIVSFLNVIKQNRIDVLKQCSIDVLKTFVVNSSDKQDLEQLLSELSDEILLSILLLIESTKSSYKDFEFYIENQDYHKDLEPIHKRFSEKIVLLLNATKDLEQLLRKLADETLLSIIESIYIGSPEKAVLLLNIIKKSKIKLLTQGSIDVLKFFVGNCSDNQDLEQLSGELSDETLLSIIELIHKEYSEKAVFLLNVIKVSKTKLLTKCSIDVLKFFVDNFSDKQDLEQLITISSGETLSLLINSLDKDHSVKVDMLLSTIKENKTKVLTLLSYSPSVKKLILKSIEEPNFWGLFSKNCFNDFVIDYLSTYTLGTSKVNNQRTDLLLKENLKGFFTTKNIIAMFEKLGAYRVETMNLVSNLIVFLHETNSTANLEDSEFLNFLTSLLNLQKNNIKALTNIKKYLIIDNNPKFIKLLIKFFNIDDVCDLFNQDISLKHNFFEVCKSMFEKFGSETFEVFKTLQIKQKLKINVEDIKFMSPLFLKNFIQSDLIDMSKLDDIIDDVVKSQSNFFSQIYQPNLKQLVKRNNKFFYSIQQNEIEVYKLLNFQINEEMSLGVNLEIDLKKFEKANVNSIIENYNKNIKEDNKKIIIKPNISKSIQEFLDDINILQTKEKPKKEIIDLTAKLKDFVGKNLKKKDSKLLIPFSVLQEGEFQAYYQIQVENAINSLKNFKNKNISIETIVNLNPLLMLHELQHFYEQYLLVYQKIEAYSRSYNLSLNVAINEIDGKLLLSVNEKLHEKDSPSQAFKEFSRKDVGVLSKEGSNYILKNIVGLDLLCELGRVETPKENYCEALKQFIESKFCALNPIQLNELQQCKSIENIKNLVNSVFDYQSMLMTELPMYAETKRTVDDFYLLKFPVRPELEAIPEVQYVNFLKKIDPKISTEKKAKTFMRSNNITKDFNLENVFKTVYDMMDDSYPQLGVTENQLKEYKRKLERLKIVFCLRQNFVNKTGITGRTRTYSSTYDGIDIINKATRAMIDILIKLSDPVRYNFTKKTFENFFSIRLYDTYVSEGDININNLNDSQSVAIEGCSLGLYQRMCELSVGLKLQSESAIENRLQTLFYDKIVGLQSYIGTSLHEREGIGHVKTIREHLHKYMQPIQNGISYRLPERLRNFKYDIDETFKISNFIISVEEFYKEKFKEIKDRSTSNAGVEESKDSELDSSELEDTQVELTENDYKTLLHYLFFDVSVTGNALINFTDDLFLDSLFKIGTYFEWDGEENAVQYRLDEELFFKKLPLFLLNFFQRKNMLEFNIEELKRKAEYGDSNAANFLGSI